MNPLLVISIDGLRADDLADPRLKIPNLRRVMAEGASVRRLKTIFPSVTWAIHNAVVTGCLPAKTGIFGNSTYDRVAGRRVSSFDPAAYQFDRDQKAPHLFGAFASRGVQVGAVCWPLTQGASSIGANIPEFYDQDHFEAHASPELWADLKAQGLPVHRYGPWSADHGQNPLQDTLTAEVADALGRGPQPGALFLHYLLIDSYQHDFGVASPEAFWAIEFVDALVGRNLAALEAAGTLDSTNVVLFSDHGHTSTTSAFYVDAWLGQNGFGGQPGEGPFVAVSNGGAGYLYNLGATEAEELRLVEALGALGYVRGVWRRAEWASLGLPTTDPTDRGLLPDVVFELRDDHYVMTGEGPGITVGPCAYRSMHGYRPDLPALDGVFAARGPGFVPGSRVDEASILDLAPMVNQIYDLGLEGMDGTVPPGLVRARP